MCRCLVLPPKAKIVDRSDRVALHNPLLRNCFVRGDRAALHTSLLRTWKAFLTRCCSRVVFDPPVLPFVRCAHNRCQTLPQHQHRITILKRSRPHPSFRLKRLVFWILSISPKISSVQLRSVFCTVVFQHVVGCGPQLGSRRCALAEIGSGART